MNKRLHIPKLANAPLQEVVFEVRWKPDIDELTGTPFDSEFELAQGKFAERLEKDFGYHRRIISPLAPTSPLIGEIVHQFRRAENHFPVVQFGPCIVTLNESGGQYEWEQQYKPMIRQVLEQLGSSYKRQLAISEVNLYYIDAIDIADAKDLLDGLGQLKISLQFDLRDRADLAGAGVDLEYRLEQRSMLHLSVRSATNNTSGKPALVWHTAVHRSECEEWNAGKDVIDAAMKWCEYAHSITSELFKNMTKGPLYDSFL